MFYINFGDFLNNFLSFGFNFVWQKRFLAFFFFLGATRLKKGQGQRAQLGNLDTNKMI
jgi:hypothetical protein